MADKRENIKADLKTAEILNTFFENIVKDLEKNQYSNFDPVINNAKDPTLRAILRYKGQPSINVIQKM